MTPIPFEVDPDSDRPRHRQLADQLRAQILNGELAPGDQLPAERDLREQTGLHRATVRAALAILRSEGLVEARRPVGTFVREAAERVVDLPPAATVRTRMPTPAERDCLNLAEGAPVLLVDRGGQMTLYAGNWVVVRCGSDGGAR